ncbi:Hypothetical_protein [Hexamita inflata]|uniref:Hypothetical_protein n=1 Tax=Hexamita inflata TaxID=28002 RepID=A0AA86NK55_9EUKA|nr:Hypothetical protein HINF_LOCUS9144 [Hexamita inflata]
MVTPTHLQIIPPILTIRRRLQNNIALRSTLFIPKPNAEFADPLFQRRETAPLTKNRPPIAVKRSKNWNNTPNLTQPSLPPRQRMYSFQITTVTRLAASVQIRISQLSTKHTTNYTTISSVLKQKLHRILTDSLVNSNSKNPNRRNTPSFWKKTSQLKFVNCDQQSPGNLLFKLQAKLFKDLKTTTTMFQGCSSQNKKHLRNLSVSIRIQRTFSSLRCQPAS